MILLLPNRSRLFWVQRLVWLILVVLGADLIIQVFGFMAYGRAKAGTDVGFSLVYFQTFAENWNIVRFIGFVALVSAFMAWWHRMVVNYQRLGHPMSETPRMTVVWWFLPLFGWFRPYAFMLEAAATPRGFVPASARNWWGFWLLGVILTVLTFPIHNAARLPVEHQLAIVFRVVGNVALMLSAWLLLPIMVFVQHGQEEIESRLPDYAVPNLA